MVSMQMLLDNSSCLSPESLKVLIAERVNNTTELVMNWTIQIDSQYSLIVKGGGSPISFCEVTMWNPEIKHLMAVVERSHTDREVVKLDQGGIHVMGIGESLSIEWTATSGMVVDRHLAWSVVLSTMGMARRKRKSTLLHFSM